MHCSIESVVGNCQPKIKTLLLPSGCSYDNKDSIDQSVCSNHECTCGPDQDARICCCRATANEHLSDLTCQAGIPPPLIVNATECGCSICDHLTIQVHVTVVSTNGNEPIAAAMVMRNDEADDSYNMLGLTNSLGRFIYREQLSRLTFELKVVAAGYMPYMSLPIRLHPHRQVIELQIMLIPSMTMNVGLGGANITVRLGPMASVSAPAGMLVFGTQVRRNFLIPFQCLHSIKTSIFYNV